MEITDRIINYLKEKYQPNAIIIYGSFADSSANENSDFDALVIAEHKKSHDSSVIGGIVLDVFIYPTEVFRSEYDPEEFIQVYDGIIVSDKNRIAEDLMKRVRDFIENRPEKSADEIREDIRWCEKMVLRTTRNDAEGYYRWHWLLFDSLSIYFDIKRLHYYGPKKALRLIEQTDAGAFRIYSKALMEFERENLEDWISYLKHISLDL